MKYTVIASFFFLIFCNKNWSQTIDNFKIDTILNNKVYILTTSLNEEIIISVDKRGKLKSIDLFQVKYPISFKYYDDGPRGYEIISNHPTSDTFWRIFFYKTGEFWGIQNMSYKKGGIIGLFLSFNKKGEIIENKIY